MKKKLVSFTTILCILMITAVLLNPVMAASEPIINTKTEHTEISENLQRGMGETYVTGVTIYYSSWDEVQQQYYYTKQVGGFEWGGWLNLYRTDNWGTGFMAYYQGTIYGML